MADIPFKRRFTKHEIEKWLKSKSDTPTKLLFVEINACYDHIVDLEKIVFPYTSSTEIPINQCYWCSAPSGIETIETLTEDNYRVACSNTDCNACGPVEEDKLRAIHIWNNAAMAGR